MTKNTLHVPLPKNASELLDLTLQAAPPNVAEAARVCAIPTWFDVSHLAFLTGKNEQEAADLLAQVVSSFSFVQPRKEGGYVYHEATRSRLLRRWHEEAERFQKLSGVAAAYYAKLRAGKSSRELGTEWEREEWERQEMYHLLVADEEQGIDLLISLLDRAGQLCRLSTFELLLKLAREQADDLSARNRSWLQFYEGKLAHLSVDWKRALEIWEALQGKRERIPEGLEKTLAIHLSSLYKDMGKWNKAIECLRRSLEVLKRRKDKSGEADTFCSLSFLYKDKKMWDEAIECLQSSLELMKETGDERGMVDTFNYLGLLYKDKAKEELDKADEYFQDSLKILKLDNERKAAATLRNLGFLYKDKREWEKADEYFQQSLNVLEKVGDEHEIADAFNNLGFLYKDKKEWKKADKYFRQSLKILEQAGDERRMADTFSYLGFLYTDKKKWGKADGYFRNGLKLLKKLGDERGEATAFNNLGLLYKSKGEWEKAEEYFGRSLKIVKEVGDEMNAATTMFHLAPLYEDMERYDKAVGLLEEVVGICERVGHPNSEIREKSREMLDRARVKARTNRANS
jgi:tetratricopeptide (TPR) repeat protein